MEPDIAKTLHNLTTRYRGFAKTQKSPNNRGFRALFIGSNQQTMKAAEAMSHELHLPLHRVDLSAVVSKYIGETEKNLERVFDVAEEDGAVLFFDEADALFGKRSEVKDSHDRFANATIGYLLQRMEQYSGLAILATNGEVEDEVRQSFASLVIFPPSGDPKQKRIRRNP